jgi:hypothetical protein
VFPFPEYESLLPHSLLRECEYIIPGLEYGYIIWFIYKDYTIKLVKAVVKAENKKVQKQNKLLAKKNEEGNERFESGSEGIPWLMAQPGEDSLELSEEEPPL